MTSRIGTVRRTHLCLKKFIEALQIMTRFWSRKLQPDPSSGVSSKVQEVTVRTFVRTSTLHSSNSLFTAHCYHGEWTVQLLVTNLGMSSTALLA